MLEGKEVEGTIGPAGEYGSYSVDVTPDANVNSEVQAKVDKTFLGCIKLVGNADLKLNIDLVAGLQKLTASSSSTILKTAVDGIVKILR